MNTSDFIFCYFHQWLRGRRAAICCNTPFSIERFMVSQLLFLLAWYSFTFSHGSNSLVTIIDSQINCEGPWSFLTIVIYGLKKVNNYSKKFDMKMSSP